MSADTLAVVTTVTETIEVPGATLVVTEDVVEVMTDTTPAVSAAASAAAAAAAVTAVLAGIGTALAAGTYPASFTTLTASDTVVIAAIKKIYLDGVSGVGGDSYIVESAANVVDHYAGGVNALRLTAAGAAVTGDASVTGGVGVGVAAVAGYALYAKSTGITSATHAGLFRNSGNLDLLRLRSDGLITLGEAALPVTVSVTGALSASTSIATGSGITTTAGLKILNGSAGAASGYGWIYPESVVPSSINYAFFAKADGQVAGINGTVSANLHVANTVIASAVASGFALRSTGKLYLDGVAGTGDTYIVESSANVLDLYAGAVKVLSLTTGGAAIVGTLTATGSITTSSGNITTTNGQITAGVVGTSGVQIINNGVIGTMDAQTLTFRTSSTSRMTINATTGDVAILSATDATSAIAASLKTAGGLAVAKNVIQAATMKHYFDGGGDTYIVESSANVLDIYAGGVNALRLTAAGAAVTGALTAGAGTFSGVVTLTNSYTNSIRTDNTSGAFVHAYFNRGSGAGNPGWITTTGDTANGVESLNLGIYPSTQLSVKTSGAAITGTISTTDPAGGAGPAWKLGVAASVSPTAPDRTLRVDVGGTSYYLAAKTTND